MIPCPRFSFASDPIKQPRPDVDYYRSSNSAVRRGNKTATSAAATIERATAFPSQRPIGVKFNWIISGRSIARTIVARHYYRINVD